MENNAENLYFMGGFVFIENHNGKVFGVTIGVVSGTLLGIFVHAV